MPRSSRTAVRRHQYQPAGTGDGCALCPAPERNTRYHPRITWLTPDASTDELRDATAAALTEDNHTLQCALEQALAILATRYRLVCALDPASVWPGRAFDRRRVIRAAEAALEHLTLVGVTRRAHDLRGRPITITRIIRGRHATAAAYSCALPPAGAAT